LEKGEAVKEVGEALLIKGSSAFMSSWSEEDDEELSWFVYKSMAAITKRSKRLRKTERKSNLLCKKTEMDEKKQRKIERTAWEGACKNNPLRLAQRK
jgi:hypothetical protein